MDAQSAAGKRLSPPRGPDPLVPSWQLSRRFVCTMLVFQAHHFIHSRDTCAESSSVVHHAVQELRRHDCQLRQTGDLSCFERVLVSVSLRASKEEANQSLCRELTIGSLGARQVLVDFYATWCGPCVMMAKELSQISESMSDQVRCLSAPHEEKLGIGSASTQRVRVAEAYEEEEIR